MKLALALLSLALAFATGCGTIEAVKRPFVTTTNAVPVVVTLPGQTNIVERIVPAETNTVRQADGTTLVSIRPAFVTNLVTIEAPRSVTNYVSTISTVVNPGLQSALDTAQSLNSLNPTPTAPFINLALLGLSGVLGWWARLKNRQLQAAEAEADANAQEADKHFGFARTMALAIEESRSADTKATVAKLSAAVGNSPELHAFVQGLTDKFKPKPG